jgi:hypothetical protein
MDGLREVLQTIKPTKSPIVQELVSSYKQALRSPQSGECAVAIKSAYDSLVSRKTWTLAPSLAGRKLVNSKWGSKLKCTDIMFFQNPPYWASRHLLIQRITAAGTSFSPVPCQTWHGYGVINAHRVDVEVGVDGYVSAPPSRAAAAAPQAGAHRPPTWHVLAIRVCFAPRGKRISPSKRCSASGCQACTPTNAPLIPRGVVPLGTILGLSTLIRLKRP